MEVTKGEGIAPADAVKGAMSPEGVQHLLAMCVRKLGGVVILSPDDTEDMEGGLMSCRFDNDGNCILQFFEKSQIGHA